jgi:hypothetical protein
MIAMNWPFSERILSIFLHLLTHLFLKNQILHIFSIPRSSICVPINCKRSPKNKVTAYPILLLVGTSYTVLYSLFLNLVVLQHNSGRIRCLSLQWRLFVAKMFFAMKDVCRPKLANRDFVFCSRWGVGGGGRGINFWAWIRSRLGNIPNLSSPIWISCWNYGERDSDQEPLRYMSNMTVIFKVRLDGNNVLLSPAPVSRNAIP